MLMIKLFWWTWLSLFHCNNKDYTPHFSSKAAQQSPCAAMCLENLNMAKTLLGNLGLMWAVRWKSCSDCKAAWVFIHLLRCLSVTLDKLPGSVRAPVCQVHYNITAEFDYRWQLGTDITYSSAQLWCQPCLPSFCRRHCLEKSHYTPQVYSSYTWQEVWRTLKWHLSVALHPCNPPY